MAGDVHSENGYFLPRTAMVEAYVNRAGVNQRSQFENGRPFQRHIRRALDRAFAVRILAPGPVITEFNLFARHFFSKSEDLSFFLEKERIFICPASLSVAVSLFFLQRRSICLLL